MKMLEQKWHDVVNSSDMRQESNNVDNLRNFLSKNNIAFKTIIIDASDNEIPYGEYTGESEIRSIQITFFGPEKEYAATDWMPKNVDNFFKLFQE